MSYKQQLFIKLLNQIDWEDDFETNKWFQNGEIDKIVVHVNSKVWDIYLKLNSVLPSSIYKKFNEKIKNTFKNVVTTNLIISVNNLSFTEKDVLDYWPCIIAQINVSSRLISEFLDKNVPKLDDRNLILVVDNKIIQNILKNNYVEFINHFYKNLGFKNINLNIILNKTLSVNSKKIKINNELVPKTINNIIDENSNDNFFIGHKIPSDISSVSMSDIHEEKKITIIEGNIFNIDIRNLRSHRKLAIIKFTDYTSSFTVKKFINSDDEVRFFEKLKKNMWIKVRGSVQEDNYSKEHELMINAYDIQVLDHSERQDTYDTKRVELHLHTNMSQMDAINDISDYIDQATKWGHRALAITDHGSLQSFPEAYSLSQKRNIKILYGVEVDVIDSNTPIAYNEKHQDLRHATYVIFDTETTGLSARYDKIIELAAVKMKDGNILEKFDQFINPGHPLSKKTIDLTSITDDMLKNSKTEFEVFKMFQQFCNDCIIVGHNATFDIDFMNIGYSKHNLPIISNPWIDTLPLGRMLYPEMKSFRLNTLARKLNIKLEHHHRAIYDAEATGHIYYAMLSESQKKYNIQYHDQFNQHINPNKSFRYEHPFHVTLLVRNQDGLKNLFKLMSDGMTKYFYRVARIPRHILTKYRDGLLVGSACYKNEVFTAMMQKGYEAAKEKAKYYDYIEIQPKSLYAPLLEQELVKNEKELDEILINMFQLAKELNKPIVASGDVHFLNKEDKIYRKILIHSLGGINSLNKLHDIPDNYFRTTDEMMNDFDFVGKDDAYNAVIKGPNKIADMCDDVAPVKDKLYTPNMKGSKDQIRKLALKRAYDWYGDPLPDIVKNRLNKELTSIIGNGFAVIYLIAQKLVFKSNKDGYLVGSRGSVGSSLVATMTGITEVNPLPPHYRCPICKYSKFFVKGEYGSGFDLPDQKCPNCQHILIKDGQDIPFETFLGFKGNKVPDIDLNFSGDYQPIGHNYTKVLFGENNVYRAGTIGTIAEKTAYGYVKEYERKTGNIYRETETDRLARGITGVKRTTGQHPAGILVVPDNMDIYDFSPIQYPADDMNATWKTTHFDFHSIHDNILKLDILGHDDPTMIRMLQDLSGIDPRTIPTDDPGVMSLFSSPKVLNVNEKQIQSKTGTLGIPEFGTNFVRGMLEKTHPSTFAELLKISGLSHGTDVWLGNAEELISSGTAKMSQIIGCRDDIMMDLIHFGVNSETSFQVMEHVRKGKGIPQNWQDEMRKAGVPEWYIKSCLKIKYMFPKAHAAAYVLMALRIAYFKVYFPIIYYAAYFSVRASDFDLVSMVHGKLSLKAAIENIKSGGNSVSTKEKNLLTILEVANEMLERGFYFKMVDLNYSDAFNWIITDNGHALLAPFSAIPGLGYNVAKQIVAAREEQPFISKQDLSNRGKVSKTIIEFMSANHVLDNYPDENQLNLFDDIF